MLKRIILVITVALVAEIRSHSLQKIELPIGVSDFAEEEENYIASGRSSSNSSSSSGGSNNNSSSSSSSSSSGSRGW